ncbi:hypothetical protein RB195_017677 [Necator americanus]|uniref:Uncharacterized protein n=1 Tax=Necator americanus TaxID=51031 RepID=A0ABR1C6B5_NECAM
MGGGRENSIGVQAAAAAGRRYIGGCGGGSGGGGGSDSATWAANSRHRHRFVRCSAPKFSYDDALQGGSRHFSTAQRRMPHTSTCAQPASSAPNRMTSNDSGINFGGESQPRGCTTPSHETLALILSPENATR